MHHHPKVKFNILWLLLMLPLLQQARGFPTINQSLQKNSYGHNIDKTVFQPPLIEETIEEVQKILAQDPTLPRLTRGEIEELYEKVTREEYEKSIEAGDMGRADSMRALMLVLPYNTDNNTEENLQELYTRPPITKVIDTYTQPNPIKFITPDPNFVPKLETVPVGNLAATTYKPVSPVSPAEPSPTTYHPSPQKRYKFKPSLPESAIQLRPITNLPLVYEYGTAADLDFSQTAKPVQRFSSHYSAKNADFLKHAPQKRAKATTTVRPVADVLAGLGIVAQTQNRRRYPVDDYYIAESAPKPVVSSYAPQSLAPKIRPDAYSNFKPLNIGEEIRAKPEVEGYLTRFGIVGGRKRKDLKKVENNSQSSDEQAVEESEIATAKIPRADTKKQKKSTQGGSSELEKLLSNLQELERLNVNPKILKTATTKKPTATTKKPTITSTTTTTTTTTTTAITPTTQNLITHGVPLLIEAKKPRRRIDPNLNIDFGATGNQQTQQGSADQLQKLLENLQELEKLRIKPENVLKTATPSSQLNKAAQQLFATKTPAIATEVRLPGLTNRFSELTQQQQPQLQQPQPHQVIKKSGQQSDIEQLQRVLQQLEALEQSNAKSLTSSTTTTTTTKQPAVRNNNLHANIAPNDFNQLRKLLSDDSALERLYEQARNRQSKPKTPTTTTTSKPGPSIKELEELQRYFSQLERMRATTTTSTTTTTTTPRPTPTITTTPRPTTKRPTTTSTTSTTTTSIPYIPLITTQDLAQRITANLNSKSQKQSVENAQLQELINRVQQLESLNKRKAETVNTPPTVTEAPKQVTGFTSRNVNQPSFIASTDNRIPSNDFAHLQQLYRQVQEAEQNAFGRIEISTAATATKTLQQNAKRTQNFAQRIVDITNDTGSGSSLLEVDPNEFIQLQKLLSKVQELERVKITADGLAVQTVTPNPRATVAPNLVTAASIRTHSIQNTNGAQVVYAKPMHSYIDELKLELPVYKPTTVMPKEVKQGSTTTPTSSEELQELTFKAHANLKNSVTDTDYEHHQQFFSNLEESERNSYRNMQPPMIQKTVSKEPPRFIATRKPQAQSKQQNTTKQQADLEELQKLLNNAQELKKLGIMLPKELSQQIEDKLMKTTNAEAVFEKLPAAKPKLTTLASAEQLDPPEVEEYLTKYAILGNTATQSSQKFDNEIRETSVLTPTFADLSEEFELPLQKTAVFSLTTARSLLPKEPKTTTESAISVPIFSATKIIEAAIKRAANKIGVSTEKAHGFLRRSDEDVAELEAVDSEELVGEFSEMNYQLAAPEMSSRMNEKLVTTEKPEEFMKDIGELKRLISNLQELQRLNISSSSEVLRQADAKYLNSLKMTANIREESEESKKNRRQSTGPTAASANGEPTPTVAPTRIQLDLSLDDGDTNAAKIARESTTTTTERATTTATTEESRNGSLADLEDSFGPDPLTESPLPPKKKNGFYFLADWNSFLEVGDGDEQVVVRLSPKIGDPRLFLPVTVP